MWSHFVLGTVALENPGLRALLPQQLHSGKLTTSLTNTYGNQLVITHAFNKLKQRLGVDYDFLVEGDDNIIFCNDPKTFNDALAIIKSLGFIATTEIYQKLEDVEFVGMHFHTQTDANGKTHHASYRAPHRALAKIGYSSDLMALKNRQVCAATMLGKAVAIQSAFGCWPRARPLVDSFLRAACLADARLAPTCKRISAQTSNVVEPLESTSCAKLDAAITV